MAGGRSRSNNSEFNWSSYHDKQLNLFDTLAKSFSTNNRVNEGIARGLSENISIMKSIANSLNPNSRTPDQSQGSNKDFVTASGFIIQAGTKAADALAQAEKEARDLARAHEEAAEAALEQARAEKEAEEKKREDAEKTRSKIIAIVDNIMTVVKSVGEQANKFSETSNQLLQNSGMSGADVRAFRSEFVSEIGELNKRTGYAYNSQAAYQSIVETVKGVTSNLEAIDEMSTPLLLAQEGMNVDTHEVAQLLNKLYVRYSFSSESMEDLLDNIRSNTAGNSANEAATLANIEKLQNIMALDITDNETREEYMSAISDITSHAESMGMDSGVLADMMKQIWEGSYQDNPLLMNILSHGGMDGNATNYLRSGDADSVRDVYEALINGVTSVVKEQKDAYSRGATIGNTTGLDLDTAADIFGAVTSENYKDLESFLEDIQKNPSKLADTVEDKYVSAMDKANNWLSSIYEKVASLQEWAGIGFTDIAGIYFLGKKILGLFGGSGGTETAGFIGKIAKGVTSNLAKSSGGSAALGGLGVTAGLAMTGYGAVNAYNSFKEGDTGHGAGYALGALGGTVGTIGLLAGSGPIGWVALALGGVALAATEMHKAMTPVSGAAKQLEKAIEKSKEKLIDEQATRISQIEALSFSIKEADNVTEALKLAKESGLIPLNDSVTYTKDMLLELANAAKETAYEVSDKGAAAYDTAKELLKDKAKDETSTVMKNLYDKVEGMMKDGKLSKDDDPTNFARVKSAFTNMAESLEDEKARKEALNMVETMFKNGVLSKDELAVFTDKGGNWNAFWRTTVDRKRAIGRHAADLDAMNSVLAGLGVEGYHSHEIQKNLDNLISIYASWSQSMDEKSRSSYVKEFSDIWGGLSKEDKSLLRESLKDIADEMQITPFAVGTNYVEKDQLALLHEGEAVVPKKYNPAADGRITSKEFSEMMRSERRESDQQARQSNEFISELIDEIVEIKDFLKTWQQDNINRERMSEVKSRNLINRNFINQYLST